MTHRSAFDALGDRIKDYESREGGRRAMRGVPLVVRVDGRSFSTFTRGMQRPFDQDLANLMTEVTAYVVEQTGAKVGYTQSDEISLILEPFGTVGTGEVARAVLSIRESSASGGTEETARRADALLARLEAAGSGATDFPFGGRFQKLCSVIAGLATARFMKDAVRLWPERCERQLPVFDARVFEVPNRDEAIAALAWREADATKNAVSMAARAHFSHARLQGRSSAQMQEMLFHEHGVNFNDYPARFKRGAYLRRQVVEMELDPATLARIPEAKRPTGPVLRHRVVTLDLPPIRALRNPAEVLIDGAAPVLRNEGLATA